MANPIKIYKTLEEAYNALLKGFRSIKNRDPDIIENQMLKAEAEGKIKSQGDNISIFPEDKPEGIMSQAPGIKSGEVLDVSFKPGMDKRGKMVKESPSQRQADLDRPFVTEEEMSAFTMEENARKLNKAKGFIDKLGAKTTKQKLFIADLVEDAGTGVFQDVDMGAVVRSNMFDDLIEQGIDDDLLTNIMYSGTKSDDFATTLAKIKSNARDEGVDIEAFLANDAGRALGNGAGADFAIANGSSKPNGVMNAAGTGVTCASATVITSDEVIDLYHSVTSPYRTNGAWIMNDATLKEIRQLKDSNNQYLWQPSLQLGNPATLLGAPVATDSNIETIATAKKVMAWGDMSKYYIREVNGIQVDRSVDYAFANDLVTFRFIYRADGDLLDTNAVKRMVMG